MEAHLYHCFLGTSLYIPNRQDLTVWNIEKGKEQTHWDSLLTVAHPLVEGFVIYWCTEDSPSYGAGGSGVGSTEDCQAMAGRWFSACGQHHAEVAMFPSDASILGTAPGKAERKSSQGHSADPGEGA